MTLGATTLTIGAESDTFDSIEAAELTGGPSVNTLDAAAFGGPVVLATGGGLDTLKGPTTGSGDVEYLIDIAGLTAPTSAADTPHQVSVDVGTRPAEIVIEGLGSTVQQSDVWWVNLSGGTTADADYVLRKTNSVLDIRHSSDEVLDVASDIIAHGRNVTLEAGTVNIVGHTLDTSSNTGNGGDIKIIGKHILIDGGSVLDSRTLITGTGTKSGKITITAAEGGQFTAAGFANVDLLDVDVKIGAATIRGGDIEILAEADSADLLRDGDFGEGSLFDLVSLDTIAAGIGGILGVVDSLSVIAGVAYARATAHVDLGTSSTTPTVISGDTVSVKTKATIAISSKPIGLNFAFAIAWGKTEAEINVANASITTTGDLTFQSTADHTINAGADTNNGTITGIRSAFGIALSVLDSTSSAIVGPDATLTVGRDLFIQAETIDRNATWGRVAVDPSGVLGVAVAVSIEVGNTTAELDGTATVGRNLNVTAKQSKAAVNAFRTFAIPSLVTGVAATTIVGRSSTDNFLDDLKSGITAKFITPRVLKVKDAVVNGITKLVTFIKDKIKGTKTPKPTPKKPPTQIERKSFQGAVGFAWVQDTNNVSAVIGDGVAAHPAKVSAVGFISVLSSISNRPDVTSAAAAEYNPHENKTADGAMTVTGGPVNFGVSIAVSVGQYHNHSDAWIAGNATVDAGGKLSVVGKAINEFEGAFGRNLVTPFTEGLEAKYKTDGGTQVLNAGDTVELEDGYAGGGEAGSVYKYIGPDGAQVDLGQEDYRTTSRWEETTLAIGAIMGFVRTLTTYLDGNFGLDNNLVEIWSQAVAVGRGRRRSRRPWRSRSSSIARRRRSRTARRSTRTRRSGAASRRSSSKRRARTTPTASAATSRRPARVSSARPPTSRPGR